MLCIFTLYVCAIFILTVKLTCTHSRKACGSALNRGAPSKPASSKRKVDTRSKVAEKGASGVQSKGEIVFFFFFFFTDILM